MAGNYSVGKIKGNDALSLSDPQTERKAIINWNRGSKCKAEDNQTMNHPGNSPAVCFHHVKKFSDDECDNQGLAKWLEKNIKLDFKIILITHRSR